MLKGGIAALRERWSRARRKGDAAVPPELGDRVLVAGWFSWSYTGATAGDLLARDVACRWLDEAGRTYDVANDALFGEGVDWRAVDPLQYSDLVFVCGPVDPMSPWPELCNRFRYAKKIGVGVTMIHAVADWNPFDVLLERDSDRRSQPDLSFLAPVVPVPLVGLVLIEQHPSKYPDRDVQRQAREAAMGLVARRPLACIPIDTKLAPNASGLRSAHEVESVIARMDAVVTTRLHGLVLALKNGVPALAIDPVAGGSKISKQAAELGWPAVVSGDSADDARLDAMLDFCLSEEGRDTARVSAARGVDHLEAVRAAFQDAVRERPVDGEGESRSREAPG